MTATDPTLGGLPLVPLDTPAPVSSAGFHPDRSWHRLTRITCCAHFSEPPALRFSLATHSPTPPRPIAWDDVRP